VFTRPRSFVLKITPGIPMYCGRPCLKAAKSVTLTCEGCGTSYSRRRCEVEKAKRQGFARSFCTKRCFLDTQTAERQPAVLPDEYVPLDQLITSDVLPTATGRRVYYSAEIAARSDGVNKRRACVSCGKIRKSKSATCRACYLAARSATQVTMTCSQCGQGFDLMRAENEKKKRAGQTERFCSGRCHHEAMRTGGRLCWHCSQPSGSRDPGRRYCSRECRAAARPRPHCLTVFEFSSVRTIYCSRWCANEAHSLRMIGAGNSHYKDGTSYADWFRKMRPLILERDQKSCRACGRPNFLMPTGRNTPPLVKSGLVIHHLNEVPADNRPENLIALCVTCHAIHHKSATTPFQWFATYTVSATRSMTSKWTATVTSLQVRYSSTTV
jgi:hypothetical protein